MTTSKGEPLVANQRLAISKATWATRRQVVGKARMNRARRLWYRLVRPEIERNPESFHAKIADAKMRGLLGMNYYWEDIFAAMARRWMRDDGVVGGRWNGRRIRSVEAWWKSHVALRKAIDAHA